MPPIPGGRCLRQNPFPAAVSSSSFSQAWAEPSLASLPPIGDGSCWVRSAHTSWGLESALFMYGNCFWCHGYYYSLMI